jgi:hypothetical protein
MKEQRTQRVMRMARNRSDRIAISAIRQDENWGGCPNKSWDEWAETANELGIEGVATLAEQFGIRPVMSALEIIESKSGKQLNLRGGQDGNNRKMVQ